MRICIIGKFPPIQGGVSMRTYLTAHSLAARGHDVHVVTNAREVRPPFRMHMRAEDWQRCAPSFGPGRVTVHWSDPVDRSQSYIPMASPFVSKLATLAADAHAAAPFDVIYSHYMEPYGVAGYLAAQIAGVPHVVRMAGSDAGRLWRHPQFQTLYDHVLQSAQCVVAVGVVAERAIERGVDPERIASGDGYVLPEYSFTPDGPNLDLAVLQAEVEQDAELRDLLWGELAPGMPHFGICGKLGDNKGTFALLAALQRLKQDGLNVGLLALAHGRADIEQRFRERVREFGLTDRVLQIPYLPHWRVPEFLRSCLAVCCLEQDFPIGFHTPIIPLETLLCGACLVASTEVIRKLPQWQRLPHGYGCVAIEDVNDVAELSGKLAAIARDPSPAAAIGARGRAFAREAQQDIAFPERIEQVLEAAAKRRLLPSVQPGPAAAEQAESSRFPLTQMVAATLDWTAIADANDLTHAELVLAALEDAIAGGNAKLRARAHAVEIEVAIARAEAAVERPDETACDPLFRLELAAWGLGEGVLTGLRPVRDPSLRVLHFEHDVSAFRNIGALTDLPGSVPPGPSHMVVFGGDARGESLLIDRFTARILELSDGSLTSGEIVGQLDRELGRAESLDHLAWIEHLFRTGLLGLRE